VKSIRRHLTKTLSYTITGFVLVILLAIDIAVDTWIDTQFDRAMQTKLGFLMTLVSENKHGIELQFSGEFLPEFKNGNEPEYFQLWMNKQIFERSDSLALFPGKDLAVVDTQVNAFKITNARLPDGRAGRVLYTKFIPQIHSRDRAAYYADNPDPQRTPMLIAYATSAEGLNFILWLIDIVFITTTIAVIVFIRLFVAKSVENGLAPLDKVNANLDQLSLVKDVTPIQLDEPIEELVPIKESLNRFIDENRQLYLREKRLTSDIAHELKTPISELINLSEVVIKFPNQNGLEKDFAPEVLRISKRLKDIVANILLLHKHQNSKLVKQDVFDVNQVIERLIEKYQAPRIELAAAPGLMPITSNLFAVETILENLISNALVHGKLETPIKIVTQYRQPDELIIGVENSTKEPLSDAELELIFEPLWQKDSSRTSGENFGLGLSIALAFAQSLDGQLKPKLKGQVITFTLTLSIV